MALRLQWTTSANHDLVRLHAFLEPVNPHAAAEVVLQLIDAAEQLLSYPQLGERLAEFSPRDVRRLNEKISVFFFYQSFCAKSGNITMV